MYQGKLAIVLSCGEPADCEGVVYVPDAARQARIAACQDAERQAQAMTREEWYTLYISARGQKMP